ncbi:aminotransferase class I/II-fold pyridoxal phosphate-dependent enzyme [Pendulispora albinea]|uniref:Aminotransferase class I/II-fold pyridoxal phosphate-dependent enzyme n=1 Tax=Pendulispora albinea TaxID=2741071 RepID=A0ABZ2M5I4_9BACT
MMPLESKLERFFAIWEFKVDYILGASDVDGYPLAELLRLADGDSLDRWSSLTLGYTETAGHPALRAEIARQYETATADDIVVCGGGAVEALYLSMHTLVDTGSHLVVVWPAFESLTKVALAAGAEVTLVPLLAEAGWELDLDAVRRALRPNTRAIVMNYPHNPTGAQLSRAAFQTLIQLARERGIPIVSDEVYRFMELDPALRLPAAADLDERSISVGVMSKAYGLAGLRVGWLACRDPELRRRIVAMKDFTTVCCSAPSEILALMALRAREQVVARCNRIVTDNLAHVDAFFHRWEGLFSWVRPKGGTVGFPLLKSPIPIGDFVTELVEQEGVLLLPGHVFDHPENRFRIGLGRRSLPRALERLDAFVSRRFGSSAR